MWSDETSQYKSANNETVKKTEELLISELTELNREIETNELVYGIGFSRPFTSVPVPRDANYLARERKLCLENKLKVNDIRKPYIQADVMQEQVECSTRNEYTNESLPIILHQFFLDKISWSIQAKHAHLLRWKRFSEHTSVIEENYNLFKNRMAYILSDYNDSLQRANRLNVCREALLNNNSCASTTTYIEQEDILIYLRWLICNFYSQKTFHQSIKMIEWLPCHLSTEYLANKASINSSLSNQHSSSTLSNNLINQNNNPDSIKKSCSINDIYSTENTAMNVNTITDTNSIISLSSILNNKFKMVDNIYLPTTNGLVNRDDVLNSISFLFNQNEIPVHNNNLQYLLPRLRYLVNHYKIDYNLSRMQTSGDEMELFAAVNRKFRFLFAQQEHMNTFRTYDIIEVSTDNWGADSYLHALKKESNWLEFRQLVVNKDPLYEKDMNKLKQKHIIDQLLLPHSNFLEIKEDERVLDALRENATVKINQTNLESIQVTSKNITQFNSNALWKKIFHNNLNKGDNGFLDEQLNELDLTQPKLVSFRPKMNNKKQDEFNFVENLQKLGLDDNKNDEQNLSNIQGSYVSYLILRHLKIRDLKRQALGLLNYFRSIEKTITIYDGGLSLEGKNYKRNSPQNHQKETGSGKNLGDHSYLYNSPKDYRINESEFMEFNDIDNHDDFYSIDERGYVHVQDQRGYFVIYDVALDDFKKLEQELLTVASYYIAKDRESQPAVNKNDIKKRRATTANLSNDQNSISLSDLSSYTHHNIDRFDVLLDIWTNEVNFLEMKKNLIDLYYESYQNIFDKYEKRNLSQVIVDLIYKRVRFDLESNYFTLSYRLEVSSLFKQARIVKIILERMIDEMRIMIDKFELDNLKYGLPFPFAKKNFITLTPNINGSTLKNFCLTEFHPCLANASRIQSVFKSALEEWEYFRCVESVNEKLALEQFFFNSLLDKIQKLDPPGYSFTTQIQKEIFNGIFIEDPLLMSELVEVTIKQLEESSKNKTKKEQRDLVFNYLADVLEMVTLRHRLLIASMETEVLSKLYRSQAVEMGFEEFHMYLRYVQFDFAKYKENAGNPPPIFVTDLNPEDSQLDRYVPNGLPLAVNEIEEGQIGRFSFKAKENILQILKPGGIDNLKIVLKLQLTHNNALISSVLLSHSCFMNLNLPKRNEVSNENNLKKSDLKEDLRLSIKFFKTANSEITTIATSAGSKKIAANAKASRTRLKDFSNTFVSIQLEKNPYREVMLNEYIKQKETKGLILSNPSEMEKLKRNLMNEYANNFNLLTQQYSLRSQLISLYFSIRKLLENFPNTRDNHFVFGEPYEKQVYFDQLKEIEIGGQKPVISDEFLDEINLDARQFKKRPRKLLSDDGKRVLNIWFIPHYTELLTMFKKNSVEFAVKTLKYCVRIMASLNDILQFLYANACMNIAVIASASTDSSILQIRRKIDFTSWENSGGFDTELNEIQLEMNQLSNPCDPELVVELLEAKRNSMFLQYDCAIRFSVRDIFLANGNTDAFKIVNENSISSLKFIEDYCFDTTENVYLNIPEPIQTRDHISGSLFPWRTFISKYGIFPMKYWPWYLIEPNISLCLTGLKEIERNVANGEILGVTLMMEDLLLSKLDKNKENVDHFDSASNENKNSPNQKENKTTDNVKISNEQKNFENNTGLSEKLLINYSRWHYFLITWKRLEMLKIEWIRRKMGVESINTPELYARYCENYKKEILIPVLKTLVKNPEIRESYENIVDYKQPILLPSDVSEFESKKKQIARLLERLEVFMIDDTIQRVQKELKLVVTERSREESTLATDLWKKTIVKEEFTINKPHIVTDFTNLLFDHLKTTETQNEKDEMHVISSKDLKFCLIRLGNMIQERERSNYEQYTVFYENLLKHQHQLMYFNERQLRSLQDNLDKKTKEIGVEVQCQMADISYDLIMEITALRSKLLELTESRENLEKEMRDKVKGEFIDLVMDLVNVNNGLKCQIDQFKQTIHDNVLDILSESRREAFDQILKLKNKFGAEINELDTQSKLKQEELIRNLQIERSQLSNLLIKQKKFSTIKELKNSAKFNRQLTSLTDESNKIKQKEINNGLSCEQRMLLLEQQKTALKNLLIKQDSEFNNLKSKLEKELKEKQNKEHELQQKLKNEKNLTSAKKSNVEKLFEELENKDTELRQMHMIQEKTARIQLINENKIQKEVFALKKNLLTERNLKLDAFQRVDDLQAQLFDLEDEITHVISQTRPQTSIGNSKRDSAKLMSTLSNKYSSPFPRLNGYTSNIIDNNITANLLPLTRPKSKIGKIKLNEINGYNDSSDDLTNDSNEIYHETISKINRVTLKSAK